MRASRPRAPGARHPARGRQLERRSCTPSWRPRSGRRSRLPGGCASSRGPPARGWSGEHRTPAWRASWSEGARDMSKVWSRPQGWVSWERLGAVLRREKAPEERPMVDYDEGFFERIRSRYERASRAVELLESELAEQPSRASDRVEQLLSELRRQRWHAEE